jgi:hypothetical protein
MAAFVSFRIGCIDLPDTLALRAEKRFPGIAGCRAIFYVKKISVDTINNACLLQSVSYL